MLIRPCLDQADRIASERVQIAVPLNTKNALATAARRQGRSMSALVREAVEDVIERERAQRPAKRTAE